MQNFDDFEHFSNTENLKEVFRQVFDFEGSPLTEIKDWEEGRPERTESVFVRGEGEAAEQAVAATEEPSSENGPESGSERESENGLENRSERAQSVAVEAAETEAQKTVETSPRPSEISGAERFERGVARASDASGDSLSLSSANAPEEPDAAVFAEQSFAEQLAAAAPESSEELPPASVPSDDATFCDVCAPGDSSFRDVCAPGRCLGEPLPAAESAPVSTSETAPARTADAQRLPVGEVRESGDIRRNRRPCAVSAREWRTFYQRLGVLYFAIERGASRDRFAVRRNLELCLAAIRLVKEAYADHFGDALPTFSRLFTPPPVQRLAGELAAESMEFSLRCEPETFARVAQLLLAIAANSL